jgi:hypothetical protein
MKILLALIHSPLSIVARSWIFNNSIVSVTDLQVSSFHTNCQYLTHLQIRHSFSETKKFSYPPTRKLRAVQTNKQTNKRTSLQCGIIVSHCVSALSLTIFILCLWSTVPIKHSPVHDNTGNNKLHITAWHMSFCRGSWRLLVARKRPMECPRFIRAHYLEQGLALS